MPRASVSTKIFRLVLVGPRQLRNALLRLLVFEIVEMHQRHRVNADHIADDELHPRQADAIGRQAPPAIGCGRVGEIYHHLGAGFGHRLKVDLALLEVERALVDDPFVAFGAGHGNLLVILERGRGLARADDGCQPHLAADNGGMAGASAVVGDNGGSLLHDRDPVGIGHAGYENRAVLEPVDLVGVLEAQDFASRDGIANGKAAQQLLAFLAQGVGLERARFLLRLYSFGARLNDEKLSCLTVLGPFHVHRLAVMRLDLRGPATELQDLVVV